MGSKRKKKPTPETTGANAVSEENNELPLEEPNDDNVNEENTAEGNGAENTPADPDAELNGNDDADDATGEDLESPEADASTDDAGDTTEADSPEPEEALAGVITITIEGDERTSQNISTALNTLLSTPGYLTTPTTIMEAQMTLYNTLIRALTRLSDTASTPFLNELLDIIHANKHDAFSARKAFRSFTELGNKGMSVQQLDEFQMMLRVLIDTSAKENRHATASKLNWTAIQNNMTERYGSAVCSRLKAFYNV